MFGLVVKSFETLKVSWRLFWRSVSKSRLGPDLGTQSFLSVSLSDISSMSLSSLEVYMGDSGSKLYPVSGSGVASLMAAAVSAVAAGIAVLAEMLAEAL